MDCKACQLYQFRKQIVPGRGIKPADLLLVGEAPGKSENLRGLAFIGPSGRLLDSIIKRASEVSGKPVPVYYITNVVCCRPTDSVGGPNREPTEREALACRSRLIATYSETKPKEVILLGKIAEKYCKKLWPAATCLSHPAFILRRGGLSSPEFVAAVRSLVEVFNRIGGQR